MHFNAMSNGDSLIPARKVSSAQKIVPSLEPLMWIWNTTTHSAHHSIVMGARLVKCSLFSDMVCREPLSPTNKNLSKFTELYTTVIHKFSIHCDSWLKRVRISKLFSAFLLFRVSQTAFADILFLKRWEPLRRNYFWNSTTWAEYSSSLILVLQCSLQLKIFSDSSFSASRERVWEGKITWIDVCAWSDLELRV